MIVLTMLLGIVTFINGQNNSFISNEIESYIQKGMKDWNIPGLALVIVKDGKTVLMKGFGVRDIQSKAPVDEETLFIIASNSKLFTGTAMAWLEHDKLLSLDDKVTQYIPWFKMYDSITTQLVTIKDMITHRLGTKTFQGDFTFWNSNLPKDSIIYKMRLLKPAGLFRQHYGYCNSGFLVAGEILNKVTGKTWEQFIQAKLLQPIGMQRTLMNTAAIQSHTNVATPYSNAFGNLEPLPYDQIDNLGPATSMVSCVKDLSKWLQFQLDSGKIQNNRITPWQVIQKTRDANIILHSRKSSSLPTHYSAYGLGEFTTTYNGKQIFWHTGGAFGFVTNVCFVPEEKLGIAILTNNDNQSFFEALRYQILDAYTGNSTINRSEAMLVNARKYRAEEEANWARLQQRLQSKPELPVAESQFVGQYYHEVYGLMEIIKENNQLVVKMSHHPQLIGSLQYLGNNEMLLKWNHPSYGFFAVPFTIENKKVTSISIKASDFVEYDAYLFKKL